MNIDNVIHSVKDWNTAIYGVKNGFSGCWAQYDREWMAAVISPWIWRLLSRVYTRATCCRQQATCCRAICCNFIKVRRHAFLNLSPWFSYSPSYFGSIFTVEQVIYHAATPVERTITAIFHLTAGKSVVFLFLTVLNIMIQKVCHKFMLSIRVVNNFHQV